MSMSEETRREPEAHQRLLDELARLEEELRTVDLRDHQKVDEYQRKIAALHKKISVLFGPC